MNRRDKVSHSKAFIRGYAAALASLNRLFDQPTMVSSIMAGDGITIEMLRTAGVDGFDINEISEALGEAALVARRKQSRSLVARAGRAGISLDEMRRWDRERRRESMSPAEKERFDNGERHWKDGPRR